MGLRTFSAACTSILCAATVALTGTPAYAADLVTLTVRSMDANGEPIPYVPFYIESDDGLSTRVTRVETDEDGMAETTALPNAAATATLLESSLVDESETELLITGGRLVASSGLPHRAGVATGTDPATLEVLLPELVERTVHVVTAAGEPVAGAVVTPLGLASVEVTDTNGTTYRALAGNQEGAGTDTAGTARFTSWAQEPDPATGAAAIGNYWDRNGVPTGGTVDYNPAIDEDASRWMPYAVLADADSEVVVPFVPKFASVTTARGTVAGSATIGATLVQPDGDGLTTPIAGERVELWAEPEDDDARLLAAGTSAANGRVAFSVVLPGPTSVFLHLGDGSHVPASIVAQPRIGDAVAATVTALKVGATSQLPRLSRAGLAVLWRSATPAVCSVTATAVVRGLRAGACSLTATTVGNPTYAPVALKRAITIRA